MKKLFFLLFILFSLSVSAQDSTVITGLQLKAKTVELIGSFIATPDNDNAFNAYLKFRTSVRNTGATNNTLVSIDSISTVILASVYYSWLSMSYGIANQTDLKAEIATVRAGNSYLNRMCTEAEDYFQRQFIDLRKKNRKLFTNN